MLLFIGKYSEMWKGRNGLETVVQRSIQRLLYWTRAGKREFLLNNVWQRVDDVRLCISRGLRQLLELWGHVCSLWVDECTGTPPPPPRIWMLPDVINRETHYIFPLCNTLLHLHHTSLLHLVWVYSPQSFCSVFSEAYKKFISCATSLQGYPLPLTFISSSKYNQGLLH